MEYIEITAKTVEEALTEALVRLETTSDQIEYEVIEKGSTGFLGFNSKPAKIKVRKKYTTKDHIEQFLQSVFKAMNLEVEILIKESEEEENVYEVELKGEEMGVLIGKRGQTLDSLQYLTNLAINRKSDHYVKVKIDTENYRERRKETLENLARNVAYKVKKTRRPVSLEPMNPFERRVIHSALQKDRYVTTHSEGEEPYRHVVVTLKNPEEGGSYGYKKRSGYNYNSYKGKSRYKDNYRSEKYSEKKEEYSEKKEEPETGSEQETAEPENNTDLEE